MCNKKLDSWHVYYYKSLQQNLNTSFHFLLVLMMPSLVVFLHVGVYSVAVQLEFDTCCGGEMVDADVDTVGRVNHLMGGIDFPAMVQDDTNDVQTNAIEEEDRDDDNHDYYYS
jgi:hypothetical protein